MTPTKLACMCAVAVAVALPAAASASPLPFKVSAKGSIHESWQRSYTSTYDCKPRTDESGGATISFSTGAPKRLGADPYKGWRGKLLADVQTARRGTRTVANCEGTAPETMGGDCGAHTFKSRVSLDYGYNPFNVGLFGDRRAYGFDCVYAPDAFPEAEQEFDTLQLLWNHGPRVPNYPYWIFSGCDAKGHDVAARKRFTIHYEDRIVRPYYFSYDRKKTKVGEYAADVEYDVTFQRVGKIRKPPRCRS